MKRRDFVYYSLVFMAGCATATLNSQQTTENLDIKSKPELLRFTVTDVQGLEELKKDYERFRLALQDELNLKIDFFPVSSYTAAVSALQLNQVDLVLAGPSEYVIIRGRTKAVPLISIQRQNYRSVVVILPQENIKSLSDLKGKAIAMGEIGSTSSHLGPTKMLIDAGLDPKSDYQAILRGKEEGWTAFMNGETVAWAGSLTDYQNFLQVNQISQQQFYILAEGQDLPSDILIASSQLSSTFLEQLKSDIINNQAQLIEALASSESTAKYKNAKLIAANDSDYDEIRQVYREIGEGNLIE